MTIETSAVTEPCRTCGGERCPACGYCLAAHPLRPCAVPSRDYDRDPQALAWARGKIQRDIARFRRFEQRAREHGDHERCAQWRKFANFLQADFIGGEGCVIAAFDERRPSLPPVDDGGPW